MPSPSSVLLAALVILLCACILPVAGSPPQPIGILTQASGAYLDQQGASAGISVFEGECLQTEAGGRASLRFGNSSLALIENSEAMLMRISNGVHIDLSAGTLRFVANSSQVVEIHAEDATIRSQNGQATDATVSIFQPKALQIDARRGGLNFACRQEYRLLPEGQVYRIYLDSPERSEADSTGGVGTGNGVGSKVTYYIVGAAGTGAIAWATYEAIHSGNQPISPAKP